MNKLFNTSGEEARRKEILLNIKNLPSIPVVILEVTQLLSNPNVSAGELAKVISTDQGLVAKILSIANSPFYGLPRRVSTIEFAIVILGFDHIKNIVIALSMIEAFNNKDDAFWNRKNYWQHCIYTATAAKRLADDLGYAKSGEAFTAGLLHDLGISVMHRYFKNEFEEIYNLASSNELDFMSAEREVLGITHCEAGAFLLEKWNLPRSLIEAIEFHHKPSEADFNKQLSALVHLADYMTHCFTNDPVLWDDYYELDSKTAQILRLGDENYIERLIETYQPLYEHQNELTFSK